MSAPMWVCPRCRGGLTDVSGALHRTTCDACQTLVQRGMPGRLRCPACDTCYETLEGDVPVFAPGQVDRGFEERWKRHPERQATTGSVFWAKTGWAPDWLKGKTILDAGCGGGRFSRIAALCGATVVGLDGSPAALAAARFNAKSGIFAQADLLHIPLADGVLDGAFSLGVLHHTAGPEAAFREVVRVVKPGGAVAIWVYGYEATDERFLPVVRFLHDVTKACPPEALYTAVERHAVAMRDAYAGQEWGPLQRVLQVSSSMDDRECVSDTFDWWCPQYRSFHRVDEVVGWFEEAGVEVTRIGDFPVSVAGVKKA